jgi:phosphoribosyl 1,2-cyclic phosphodiesterase
MKKLRFLSLGSGSSGNCYYLGDGEQGILIDAGIAARTVRKGLKEIGTDLSQVLGVFISHDHIDHIKSIGVLGAKYHLPLFASTRTYDGMDSFQGLTKPYQEIRYRLEPGERAKVGDFEVAAYPVSHDASECVCFHIRCRNHAILIATDLGCANDSLGELIRQSDTVVIEANYDADMLNNGSYPARLKKRIDSNSGHLCNSDTARLLADNWHDGLKYVFLCHLSKENNLPDLAMQTVLEELGQAGIYPGERVRMEPLNRQLHEVIMLDD